ncbi:MAG: response regulator [Chloroflexi bacterium]|nr:response regulator [Chloroflexota bacterium]
MANNNNGKDMGSRLSVLIVEDSSLQALKLKVGLEHHGCRVDWADTGLGGLALAQQKYFDLIVLDIELPDTDGFQVCQKLKANPELADIPVVMMTTRDYAEDVMNGLEVGAVDYIPKDAFAEAVLLETIRQMELHRS